MSSLFDRVSGLDGEKIAINLIRGLCSEIHNGRQTVASASVIMGLNDEQVADLTKILTKAQLANNSLKFSEVMFSRLALAEIGVDGYTSEADFWAMVDEEAAK